MNERPVRVDDPTTGQMITMPAQKRMPWGNTGTIDREACYPAYRCDTCNAIEGSIGMPSACNQETTDD